MNSVRKDLKGIRNRGSGIWLLPVLLAFVLGTVGSSAALGARAAIVSHSPGRNQAESLESAVYKRLVMIPWYTVFDNLQYKVEGTKVTLYGQVVYPLTRSSVEGYVKGTPGVTRIVNHVQNLPDSPFDRQIRRAEYRAIFLGDSPLFYYSLGVNPGIHIIVDNSRVTLEGVVNNQADRDLATLRAKSVPFVFSVTNHLTVSHS